MSALGLRRGSTRGYLLLELIIAGIILWITIAAFTSGMGIFWRSQKMSAMSIERQRLINTMMERIRDNPGEFQGSLFEAGTPQAEAEIAAMRDALPLAFTDGQHFYAPADCTDCPGRGGVLLHTVPNAASLSMVTLFIRHENYFPNNEIRTVRFVVSPVR